MAQGSSEAEMQTFLKWFQEWDTTKRREFLEKLLPKVTPHKLFAMTAGLMSTHTHPTQAQNCITFEDKVAYIHSSSDKWSADEGNQFLCGLEEIDESIMNEFYAMVASTVQEP